MIKNDAQLAFAETRLSELAELLQPTVDRPLSDVDEEQLSQQALSLRFEIREYRELKEMPIEEAVSVLAGQPIPIERIGELLSKLRIASKLTQKELAEKLGWEQSNISRFENESYSSQTIAKISEYLNGLGLWVHVTPSLNQASTRQLKRTIFEPSTRDYWDLSASIAKSNNSFSGTEKESTGIEGITSGSAYASVSLETGSTLPLIVHTFA